MNTLRIILMAVGGGIALVAYCNGSGIGIVIGVLLLCLAAVAK